MRQWLSKGHEVGHLNFVRVIPDDPVRELLFSVESVLGLLLFLELGLVIVKELRVMLWGCICSKVKDQVLAVEL